MERSKIAVVIVLISIAFGVGAWSWLNLFASPPYDPAQAQDFVRHFDVRCGAEHDEELCRRVIGDHHRRCFEHHLDVDDDGNVVYDRATYLECMQDSIDPT